MSAQVRGLLQAEWWPRDGWGSATPSSIPSSFPIGCILNSARKDFTLYVACQNTCRKAAARKAIYIAYFITFYKNLEGDVVGLAHRFTSENQSPAVTSSNKGNARFGGNYKNTVNMKQSIKDCSLSFFFSFLNM